MDGPSFLDPPRRLAVIVFAVGLLLAIPLIAMQFTNEVHWTGSDFLVAGTLLLGTGLLAEGILRTFTKRSHRLAWLGVLGLVLLLVWAELAVGVFGTPFAGS